MNPSELPSDASTAVAERAIKQNYWTISIEDLDRIIDSLERRANTFGGQYPRYGAQCREAEKIVVELRNELLAINYDANRQGKPVAP